MLQIKGVSYKDILKDISFSINAGDLIIVTGPNGSGKSTLAKCIVGIEKIDSGELLFKGEDIREKSCTERARLGFAYSFQQPVHFKGVTVRDLLRIATGDEKVDTYLKKVGLEPELYLDREINASLSGGELKRIEIASVIARKAELYIFDEPEAGIDIWSFGNLIKVFKDMRKRQPNSAIVIISHQERIMKIASRIILLKDGKIALSGSADKVLPQLEKMQ